MVYRQFQRTVATHKASHLSNSAYCSKAAMPKSFWEIPVASLSVLLAAKKPSFYGFNMQKGSVSKLFSTG